MATILKAPPTRGIVVFTTQERDKLIRPNKKLRKQIEDLKPKWLIGLHHNWHDYSFKHDQLFDFNMAGEGDLRGDSAPLIELDACNFVPDYFKIVDCEKYWDLLYVARTVFFKRVHVFFNTIQRLYAAGSKARILLIAPVKDRAAEKELHARYAKFTQAERNRFTIIAPTHDYPFPYDIETLAFFYRHSKVFVHFADEERRCRVIAYAWASGMPVVCRTHPSSILSNCLRKPPIYYQVNKDEDFPRQIREALKVWPTHRGQNQRSRAYFAQEYTVPYLKQIMAKKFGIDQNNYLVANLDIRLGRHLNLATGSNKIPLDIDKFVKLLHDNQFIEAFANPDPEMALIK